MIEQGLQLGEVSRIDFVNKPIGDTNARMAYVHFSKWYDNRSVEELRNQLNTVGSKKFYKFGSQATGSFSFKGSLEANRYLVFKINHKPIPDAPEGANAAQLAAANVYLENQMKIKDAEIAELKALLSIDGKGAMQMSELETA
jgi:hypothetical protein